MKKLTNKEKEIMELYWQYGPMFVRELQEAVSSFVKEEKISVEELRELIEQIESNHQ